MKKLLCFAIAVFFVGTAHGATYLDCHFESAPSSEENGGIYTCDTGSAWLDLRTLTGNVFEHTTNEGWQGSGAAKFYTYGAGSNGDRFLRHYTAGGSGTQRNLRFLIKFETYGNEYGGKWSDSGGTWRTWVSWSALVACGQDAHQPFLCYDGTLCVIHGQGETSSPCGSYEWCANSGWGRGWGGNLSDCTIVETDYIDLANYVQEWICVEIEKNSSGHYKVYIWTTDGAFSGLYYWADTTFSGNTYAPAMGAYLESGDKTNKYFIIDEAVVSDEYIGPPSGFVSTGVVIGEGATLSGAGITGVP